MTQRKATLPAARLSQGGPFAYQGRMAEPATRLDEFSKDEWRDVCRRVRPDIDDEQFEQEWQEFEAAKRMRKVH